MQRKKKLKVGAAKSVRPTPARRSVRAAGESTRTGRRNLAKTPSYARRAEAQERERPEQTRSTPSGSLFHSACSPAHASHGPRRGRKGTGR
uniref:Uncharacterized protein n=1 Tax=Arundo donax TaxID=35708 RepID=A0A0A9ACK6_ARUDO